MGPAVITLVVLGGAFGAGLFVASRFFSVEVDPRAEKIAEILPGANCGGCSFGGCAAYAKAVAAGAVGIGQCAPGGEEVAQQIADIMGLDFSGGVKKVSVMLCAGDSEQCPGRAKYDGISECTAATLVHSGGSGCSYGCIGLGSCVEACPFDAIVMTDKGLPYVIEDRCTGCGKCVEACPRNLFELRPVDAFVHVRCSNHARGPETRKICKVGCIGCGLCVKECKFEAIEIVDNLAVIDYEKCKSCGLCVAVCPQNAIWSYRKVRKDREKAAKERAASAAP